MASSADRSLPCAAEGDPLPRYVGSLSWRDDWPFEHTPTTHAEPRPRRTTGWPASRERLMSKRSIVFPWDRGSARSPTSISGFVNSACNVRACRELPNCRAARSALIGTRTSFVRAADSRMEPNEGGRCPAVGSNEQRSGAKPPVSGRFGDVCARLLALQLSPNLIAAPQTHYLPAIALRWGTARDTVSYHTPSIAVFARTQGKLP